MMKVIKMARAVAVVSTIPKIVCETLAALGLQEEIPSWKIMDNKVIQIDDHYHNCMENCMKIIRILISITVMIISDITDS